MKEGIRDINKEMAL